MSERARRLGMNALTHFSVCRSGKHVEIGFTDHAGEPVALQLPQECLSMLLMTLPSIIEAALRRRTGNPELRQVYPLGDWQLHLGSEPESIIISLAVIGLPVLIKDDGTARGFTQILLTYTLGAITALLGLSTLWLACGTLARDIMTHEVVTVQHDTSLAEIADLMEAHSIKRVPVLNGDKLVGIVSRSR